MYQKIFKRTGYVYAALVSEEEKQALLANPHTKDSFEFRAVKTATTTATKEGEKTEPKEVKKLPKAQTETEQ